MSEKNSDRDRPGRPVKKKAEKPVEFKAAIAAWDSAYEKATGHKPTWRPMDFKTLRELVVAKGEPEVIARILRLFDGGLPWVTTVPGISLLSRYFDQLVGGRAIKLDTAVEQQRRIVDKIREYEEQEARESLEEEFQ